ncbi:LCP family protein [Leucobacter sp. wl10]|uniref:LCP family protein n=1 Tax=Leucobacter sp. wl10 TaxID=2304677 RepID=UPI001F094666|nr:LCP family protein [Leucobacter sp. wl10]
MTQSPSPIEQLFAEADRDAEAQRAAPKRKRRGLRNTLIVLGSLIALLGIGAGIVYAMIANSYNEIERVSIEQDPSLERPAVTTPEPGKKAPINVLLLGSDSRETTDPTATAEDLKGFRSDTIMVAQISPDRQNLTVMSIMRDNWVGIQGVGEAKINAAVAYGGLPLAVNTVENFIGARIDHVALIDFESFKGLTDAVGGVTVRNEVAFTNQNGGGSSFEAGDITLNGEQALGFVRERYAFADGDYQRARNQQAYLKGLMQKVLSRETLGNVGRLTDTFQALKPYLILDQKLDLPTAVSLGFDMRNLRSENITLFTSPTLGTGTSADGQSIVVPDQAALEEVRAAFQAGTINEYAAARPPGSEVPQ